MPRDDYNVRITRQKRGAKMATSLRETNATPEVRYAKSAKGSDEYKEWWTLPSDKIGGAVNQIVERIDQNNYEERNRYMRYARLYGDYAALGWAALSAANRTDSTNNKPTMNVIQSSIDTLNSKIARDNPAPYFITSGADYFDKLKAEKQTQFVQGVFQQCGFYAIANNKVFRDGLVYGLGAVEWYFDKKKKRIAAEWCFIDELKVDRWDGAKGKPLSIHRVKLVAKEELRAEYDSEEQLAIIDRVTTARPYQYRGVTESVVEMVVYKKSWHLPVGNNPGRFVVTIEDEVLLDEPYEEETFPFSAFRWMEKPVGYCGRGVTDEILTGQVEINKILLFIQQCQELMSSPVILVPKGAQIAKDALLSNNVARMIEYAGALAPAFVSPTSTGGEIYSHLQWWITNCYGKVGISQTAASGEKQPGVNSAIAMRTMVDVESSRFIQVSKNWEQFFVDCATIVVKLGKKAFAKDENFSVDYVDKKSKILKTIPWSKIHVEDDAFVIRCDTVSGFPATAAGRIQTVTDFISNHFISMERGMELLNIDPDLEDEVKLATSSLRLCEKSLAEMVEDNKYTHPEKYMNLKLTLAVSLATYNQLRVDGCPEERLKLVRNWLDEVMTLLGAPDPQVALIQQMFAGPGAQPANANGQPMAPQAGLQPAA